MVLEQILTWGQVALAALTLWAVTFGDFNLYIG